MQQFFSTAREIAHSAIAVIAALAASAALVVAVLATAGVHVTQDQVIYSLGVAGGVAALISKGIDSLNNAVKSPPAATVVSYTPLASVQTVGSPVVGNQA